MPEIPPVSESGKSPVLTGWDLNTIPIKIVIMTSFTYMGTFFKTFHHFFDFFFGYVFFSLTFESVLFFWHFCCHSELVYSLKASSAVFFERYFLGVKSDCHNANE